MKVVFIFNIEVLIISQNEGVSHDQRAYYMTQYNTDYYPSLHSLST